MQTNKGKRTKDRIIKRATDILYKQGHEALTLQHIARDIEISQPSMYNHFRNKSALMLAVCQKAYRSYYDYMTEYCNHNTAADIRLKSYLSTHFQWHQQEPKLANILIGIPYFAQQSKDYKKIYDDYQVFRNESLEHILQQGEREQIWQAKINALNAIDSLLIGHSIKAYYTKIDIKIILSDFLRSTKSLLRD